MDYRLGEHYDFRPRIAWLFRASKAWVSNWNVVDYGCSLLGETLVTAAQMIELIRTIPAGDARATFYQLANQVYNARLKDGGRLMDAMDFVAWLRELGEECARTEGQLLPERSTGLKVMPLPPRLELRLEQERLCPGCGHVHEGDYECEKDMGGAGKCGCRMEVRV